MHALVITPTLPPRVGLDVNGVYKRHALFISALSAVAKQIHIIHLVPPAAIKAFSDATQLDHDQSMYWRCTVSVSLLARRSRQETVYNHYVAGAFTSAQQPSLYPFGGTDLARALRQRIDDLAPDIVLAMTLPAMMALRASGARPSNLFFDFDDVPHRVRVRASLQSPLRPGKLAYLAHVPALVAAARHGARSSRATFTCSDVDRRHLIRWGIAGNVAVIPNAVTLPLAPPRLAKEPTLLFLGAFHYGPNVEAAERLVRRIFPLVRAHLPQARLLIAGDGSDRLPVAGAAPARVEYLGFVSDLDSLYARSRVVCAPIANGGGTRLKLVEAAAYGKPMVATRIGAEGLDFIDGVHILLREHDTDIAEACIRLLRNDTLAVQLGNAAQIMVRHRYEVEAIRSRLARLFVGETSSEPRPSSLANGERPSHALKP
jgi:glycosyltransferase involved in cell wall biosynthesis